MLRSGRSASTVGAVVAHSARDTTGQLEEGSVAPLLTKPFKQACRRFHSKGIAYAPDAGQHRFLCRMVVDTYQLALRIMRSEEGAMLLDPDEVACLEQFMPGVEAYLKTPNLDLAHQALANTILVFLKRIPQLQHAPTEWTLKEHLQLIFSLLNIMLYREMSHSFLVKILLMGIETLFDNQAACEATRGKLSFMHFLESEGRDIPAEELLVYLELGFSDEDKAALSSTRDFRRVKANEGRELTGPQCVMVIKYQTLHGVCFADERKSFFRLFVRAQHEWTPMDRLLARHFLTDDQILELLNPKYGIKGLLQTVTDNHGTLPFDMVTSESITSPIEIDIDILMKQIYYPPLQSEDQIALMKNIPQCWPEFDSDAQAQVKAYLFASASQDLQEASINALLGIVYQLSPPDRPVQFPEILTGITHLSLNTLTVPWHGIFKFFYNEIHFLNLLAKIESSMIPLDIQKQRVQALIKSFADAQPEELAEVCELFVSRLEPYAFLEDEGISAQAGDANDATQDVPLRFSRQSFFFQAAGNIEDAPPASLPSQELVP
jgi:hypothetical protein